MRNQWMAALAAAAAIFIPAEVHAKQCIWNKGAYVLKVDWYRPGSLSVSTIHRPHGDPIRGFAQHPGDFGKPVRSDVFPSAQGRCNETNEELTAIVYVIGRLANDSYYAPNTLYGRLEHTGGMNFNIKVDKLACAAQRCAGQFNPPSTPSMRDVQMYLAITPPTDRYVDFWGGTLDTQHGPGGKI